MPRTRIKICGITRKEDAVFAAAAGADAIGLVFYPGSPRAVGIDAARAIVQALPPFVTPVALFVNASAADVRATLAQVGPVLLQFHGDEDPAYCAGFATPYLKALRVGEAMPGVDLLKCREEFQSAQALLLDTAVAGLYGGSGETFDWQRIPQSLRPQVVLSGGLTVDNVGAAVRLIRPWAVDVSSGVEATKGVKDHRKIAQFIEAVKNADV